MAMENVYWASIECLQSLKNWLERIRQHWIDELNHAWPQGINKVCQPPTFARVPEVEPMVRVRLHVAMRVEVEVVPFGRAQ